MAIPARTLWLPTRLHERRGGRSRPEPSRPSALDTTTVNLLRQLWRHHRHTFTASGRNSGGYLFVDTNGQRLRPDYLTRRLATLITEAGLPPVRLHDLRHGAASLALAAGVDLKVVQEMLGHASIVTTADTYTSVLSEAAHAAAQALPRSCSTPPAPGSPSAEHHKPDHAPLSAGGGAATLAPPPSTRTAQRSKPSEHVRLRTDELRPLLVQPTPRANGSQWSSTDQWHDVVERLSKLLAAVVSNADVLECE
jgi:Phage integrase family